MVDKTLTQSFKANKSVDKRYASYFVVNGGAGGDADKRAVVFCVDPTNPEDPKIKVSFQPAAFTQPGASVSRISFIPHDQAKACFGNGEYKTLSMDWKNLLYKDIVSYANEIKGYRGHIPYRYNGDKWKEGAERSSTYRPRGGDTSIDEFAPVGGVTTPTPNLETMLRSGTIAFRAWVQQINSGEPLSHAFALALDTFNAKIALDLAGVKGFHAITNHGSILYGMYRHVPCPLSVFGIDAHLDKLDKIALHETDALDALDTYKIEVARRM